MCTELPHAESIAYSVNKCHAFLCNNATSLENGVAGCPASTCSVSQQCVFLRLGQFVHTAWHLQGKSFPER